MEDPYQRVDVAVYAADAREVDHVNDAVQDGGQVGMVARTKSSS